MTSPTLPFHIPEGSPWQQVTKMLTAARSQVRSTFDRWWRWKHRSDSIWAALFMALVALFAWTLVNSTNARWH